MRDVHGEAFANRLMANHRRDSEMVRFRHIWEIWRHRYGRRMNRGNKDA